MKHIFEMHSQKDVFLSHPALVARLEDNYVHALRETEVSYKMSCGILVIQISKFMELGNLASFQISEVSGMDKWLSLFDQIEKLGCRLYDPAKSRYVSRHTFEEDYAILVKTQNDRVIPYEVLKQKREDSTVEFKSVGDMFAKIIEELREAKIKSENQKKNVISYEVLEQKREEINIKIYDTADLWDEIIREIDEEDALKKKKTI